MTPNMAYSILLGFSFILAGAVFVTLFFVSAPYGRHSRRGWGALIPNRLGWLIMEAPSALGFALLFWTGSAAKNEVMLIFLCLWEAHYIHRAFIYTFSITEGTKQMPALVMFMAFGFNIGNAFVNGWYIFSLSGGYPAEWLKDPRFLLGISIFLAGYGINRWADFKLRRLRKPGETGYSIPYGGLFRWISCPNYFGEIIEWAGWAIATWSLPGLAFAVWTFANLAPRARAHHAWYRQRFPAYPEERKALLPGLW